MKILLVGVGGVGEAMAMIAKPHPWVEQLVLADYNLERVKEVQSKLGDDKRFPAEKVDAKYQEQIEAVGKEISGRSDNECLRSVFQYTHF